MRTEIEVNNTEDAGDTLDRKAAQLHAMLTTIVGEGFQTFSNLGDTTQENFLWACRDMAEEIKELSLLVATCPAKELPKTGGAA